MGSLSIKHLHDAWEHFVCRSGSRPRDAAEHLLVSEAELFASRCGMDVIRLKPEWPALFSQIRALGPAIAVTRNVGAAMVKAGVYALPQFASAPLGQIVGTVNLRLFTAQWGNAFALAGDLGQRTRRCICIFDRHGNAVHEIMLHPESCTSAFANLMWSLHADDQSPSISIEPFCPPSFSSDVDADKLRDAVRIMSCAYEFREILRRFNITREHALRLIGSEHAWRINRSSIQEMLLRLASSGNPLTCFVENPGMLHIHTGAIERIEPHARWFSILDPGFNFHLHEASVANVWILRKPNRNGFVTSVEAYDHQGSLLVQFFGQRSRNGTEEEHWRTLTASLPRVAA